ncbi:hypothetical protein B0T24DRAFT_600255 [Lasiosphaeria ovina]|uniref:Myb/SANT-like domain-containing protein n=1 Tax=Lasiosphaeria ovina TaxID=92902 RepID=A0AAE0JS10_9PEZI|nr:hypothetical protein B0T24DRAFT_600255 [Lasiosphaeria ovina]
MCNCIDLGLRPKGTKFLASAYLRTAAEVGRQANVRLTRHEVRSLMKAQRRKYRSWLELGEVDGAVWDDDLQQWILGPAEWDELIADRSEMRQFRGRTLQWLDLSTKLWGGLYRPVLPVQRRRSSSSSC